MALARDENKHAGQNPKPERAVDMQCDRADDEEKYQPSMKICILLSGNTR